MGYKTSTDFFSALGSEMIDINDVIARYETLSRPEEEVVTRSADEFELQQPHDEDSVSAGDVVVIGDNIKGINYRLARCCNPINGDPVFGFISAEGVIKVHRADCPNARNIKSRYPYRVIPTRWAGSLAGGFGA